MLGLIMLNESAATESDPLVQLSLGIGSSPHKTVMSVLCLRLGLPSYSPQIHPTQMRASYIFLLTFLIKQWTNQVIVAFLLSIFWQALLLFKNHCSKMYSDQAVLWIWARMIFARCQDKNILPCKFTDESTISFCEFSIGKPRNLCALN